MVKDLKIDDTIWKHLYKGKVPLKVTSISKYEIFFSNKDRLDLKEGDQTSWELRDKYGYFYFLNKVDVYLHQRKELLSSAKKRRSEIIELTTKLSNIEEALEENHKELIKIQKQ